MNKLTEEQIFKALEWHTNEEENDCIECPYKERKYFGNCVEFLLKDILNLLNRQKAEIERLKIRNKTLTEITNNYDWKFKKAKSEARKEFAERVKPIFKEMFDLMIDDDEGKCIIENCKKHSSVPCMNEYCIKENKEAWLTKIDNLLKEMEGD